LVSVAPATVPEFGAAGVPVLGSQTYSTTSIPSNVVSPESTQPSSSLSIYTVPPMLTHGTNGTSQSSLPSGGTLKHSD